MTIEADHRLEVLISTATRTIRAAVTAMEHANRELVELLEIRSRRPWTVDEFARYLDLCHRERAAHRQYVTGRHRFDNARRMRTDESVRASRDIGNANRS